jgi:hypothetical protein
MLRYRIKAIWAESVLKQTMEVSMLGRPDLFAGLDGVLYSRVASTDLGLEIYVNL